MTTIGLVGAGAMGSALGAGWIAGGAVVVTCAAGRSERTRGLVDAAGIGTVADLDELVAASDMVVSVVPPGAALVAAGDVAAAATRTGARPLVVDLNAVAPTTVQQAQRTLAEAGCTLVDGSISGGPPRADAAPTRVYVSGPDAGDLGAVASPWLDVVRLDGPVGAASALKMCTASMYKGTRALVMQAMLTADAHGVLGEFCADTARAWPDDVPTWHIDIAMSATKAWRFVEEMHQIARTQGDAGLATELFAGVAAAYERAARTPLGHGAPEAVDRDATVDEVLAQLREAAPRRE